MTRPFFLALFCALLAACPSAHEPREDASGEDSGRDVPEATDAATEPDVARSDAPSDVLRDAPIARADAPVPTFDGIYESILVPRCARCHGPDALRRFRMDDAASAYDALIDVPVENSWITTCVAAWEPPLETAYRVRPYDTRASMLAFLADCYVRDAEHDVLTASESETLRAWIEGGAPETAFSP